MARFQKGQSGNPGGKPINARTKINNVFLTAVAEDFEKHGVKALERLRNDSVVKYCELVAGLLPTESKTETNVNVTGTVAHEHIPVSDVDRWIVEALGSRKDGDTSEALPN